MSYGVLKNIQMVVLPYGFPQLGKEYKKMLQIELKPHSGFFSVELYLHLKIDSYKFVEDLEFFKKISVPKSLN